MYCVAPEPETGILYEYRDPVTVERALCAGEIPALIARVSRRSESERLYAVGYVSYEAAAAFDASCTTKKAAMPLACFALYAGRVPFRGRHEGSRCFVSPLLPEIREGAYRSAIGEIRRHLRDGESYQVNLTFRLRARYFGDTLDWFLERASAGHGRYAAYLRDGTRSIASFSPELFFTLSAAALEDAGTGAGTRTILLRPMKGTARPETGHEAEVEARLKADPKNRAENLMITDMIRNDVGKIALPGSVYVRDLYGTETFPTVVQMTSTVVATTRVPLSEAFGALFPCASITGAPKVSSMRIIERLEASPRGPYTGAIGVVRPDGSSWFSVAIRTAVFDDGPKTVEYGTGSGIVWDSNDREEWEECMLKASVVTGTDGFYVFESLLLEDGSYFLRERHLARLAGSLVFFGFATAEAPGSPAPEACVRSIIDRARERLDGIARANPAGSHKVRLAVRASGSLDVSAEAVTPLPDPYRIALAPETADSANPFLRHKTSVREPIERALRLVSGDGMKAADDVVMINERGELTESSRANVVLEMDGVRYTPPLEAGILPGVFRAELLSSGEIRERTLYPRDFESCGRVFIINSVRRFVECVKAVR